MTFTAEEKQEIKDAWNQNAAAMRPKNLLKKALMRVFNEPKSLYGGGSVDIKGNAIVISGRAKMYSARQIAKGIDKDNAAGKAGLHFVEHWMSESKSPDRASKFEDALKMVRR